jgi:transposase-like protein
MHYQTVPLRQRIWEDIQLEVQAEYGRGLSYRQIKQDFDQRLGSSMSLRTLNTCLLKAGDRQASVATWKVGTCPPVVRVDGIWITVMFTRGETKRDKLGRQRPVKYAKRIPILAAQGVWPAQGRKQLLAWQRAEGEDTASWQNFLELLYESGLTPQNGLALLVADGSQGFRAAYENVYWMVPFQRCVFHKLHNLAHKLNVPDELERQAARDFRSQFLRSASEIWQAPDEEQARERFEQFCHTWEKLQTRAIDTLKRDFEATLSFYAVQQCAVQRGEHWPSDQLRTTSALERMFREFRRRYRSASLFHSEAGAVAATAQVAKRFS